MHFRCVNSMLCQLSLNKVDIWKKSPKTRKRALHCPLYIWSSTDFMTDSIWSLLLQLHYVTLCIQQNKSRIVLTKAKSWVIKKCDWRTHFFFLRNQKLQELLGKVLISPELFSPCVASTVIQETRLQITEIKDKIDQSRDRKVILNWPEDTHIEAKVDCV